MRALKYATKVSVTLTTKTAANTEESERETETERKENRIPQSGKQVQHAKDLET